MGPQADPAQLKLLRDGFAAAGKKLDMGVACIHFRKVDDLPLDVIGRVIAGMPVDRYLRIVERSRKDRGK